MFNFDALSQADRTWLAGRPEFSNWQAGCEKVCKHLDECTGEYVPLVFSGQPTKGVFEDCRRSIWRTWFSFWTAAVEFVQKYGQTSPRSGFRVPDDGYKVADFVRQGIRPTTGLAMGGNPFRDVVLARGALAGDSRSIEQLQSEYMLVFNEVMKQTEGYCDPSVWLSIVQELVCRVGCDKETLQPGRLASYRGESSLRAWLRPVIRNYLTDRSRPEALRIADFDLRDTSLWKLSSEIEASGSAPLELLEYFRVHLLRALSELTPIQRRILFMYFGEHRHNYSIAVILGISPGNVSRQRKIAVDQLVSLMRDAVTSMTQVAEKQAFLALWDKRRSLPRPELVDVLLGGLESGYRIGVDPIGFVRGPGNPNFSETGVCDEPWPNSRHAEIRTKPREDKEKGSSAVES